jgi:tetratricopeptide (TPR) repeat protein
VIKVLTPELAAGVNRERFDREIRLLATLQHPLLVPVLSAGQGDGLVWYTMPFVEGESLRDRLRRGPVPQREAIAILVDMAQGLAEAHRRGVVHRDVKPENVLLSGGRAVVADFGIAKALSDASNAQAGLTASGIAVGTPAYMAPEQAAGEPDIDARADIYALGCVGYELLAGRPPFEAPTPSQLLMAHVVQQPAPLAQVAPQVAPALGHVIMRCLAKEPADRWPDAASLAAALDEARYGASGETSGARAAAATGRSPRATLAGLAGVTVVLTALAHLLPRVGLAPRFVAPAAIVVGLTLIASILWAWRRATPALARTLVRASAVAYAGLTVGALGFAGLRAAGVGPMASLISAGKLAEQDRLLVAEFTNGTGDATLGDLITDALRTDLAQSRSVRVMPRSDVNAALARMEKAGATVDSALAFGLAQRTGISAVLLGNIVRLGRTVVISTRLVAANGDELAGFREVAEGDEDIIPAVGRLSRAMREKLGESLRSVATAPALEAVTTGSLDALRKYTEALRVSEQPGTEAFQRERALLEEAVKLDTNFGMAWRRLGVRLASSGIDARRGREAITRAYGLRDRLSPVERGLAEAAYFGYVSTDKVRMQRAYEEVLAADSNNRIALNNTASFYFEESRWREALATTRRLLAADSANQNGWTWYLGSLLALDQKKELADGWGTLRRLTGDDASRFGPLQVTRLQSTYQLRDVRPYVDSVSPRVAVPSVRAVLQVGASQAEYLLGHLEAARKLGSSAMATFSAGDTAVARQSRAYDESSRFRDQAFLHGDTAAARRWLTAALAKINVTTLPVNERGYANLAYEYALLGDGAAARRALDGYWAAASAAGGEGAGYMKRNSVDELLVESMVLQAERRHPAAIVKLRQLADSSGTSALLALGLLGDAYRAAGQRDSALAYYRRWIDLRDPRKFAVDQSQALTPRALRHGCGLADEAGDVAAKRKFCGGLVELWRDADAELQPYVTDAKARLAREPGRSVAR